jgi:hypothetical protein
MKEEEVGKQADQLVKCEGYEARYQANRGGEN